MFFSRCERDSRKTRVRVASETFVEARKEKMNQLLEKLFQHKWGRKFPAGFSFQMIFSTQNFFAAVQRRSLSARSSAARTVETMPPRKWKQMW